jgi:hypothetical protein
MQQSFWLGLDFSTTKIETTLQIYQISKHDKFGLREPREQSLCMLPELSRLATLANPEVTHVHVSDASFTVGGCK